MRKAVVFPAVLLLLIVPMVGQAADLGAGWYAKIRSVNVYVYDYQGRPTLIGGGCFYSTPPGQYGPFQVTDLPDGGARTRQVLVNAAAHGAESAASLDLPISTGRSDTDPLAFLDIWWETNYDASQMYLELIQRDVQSGAVSVLWTQRQSGSVAHEQNLAYGATAGGLSLRVVVVPEPSSLAVLLISVSGTALCALRRRRMG